MPTDLEADIQSAWKMAQLTLPLASPDKEEVLGLIAALCRCAARARSIGFLTGESELLRMVRFLEGRIANADFPRYGISSAPRHDPGGS
jgi:hypothetical protein